MRKTVYWIEGDGIGPDVWKSARPVIDEAIRLSYGDGRGFDWKELLAGEKALKETGTLLPDETLAALRGAELAIKGPLGTPVGTGFRSLNVTLRQTLDLYACIRPIRYFEGIESPVKHPERVDMIVFRENTEDVYAGIEYKAGTPEAAKLIAFLRDELGAEIVKTQKVRDFEGHVVPIDLVRLDSLRMGDALFRDHPVLVMPDTSLVFACLRVDGIAGCDLLRWCAVRMPNADSTITVTDDVRRLGLPRGRRMSRMELGGGCPFLPVTCRNGDRQARMYVKFDTGSAGYFHFSYADSGDAPPPLWFIDSLRWADGFATAIGWTNRNRVNSYFRGTIPRFEIQGTAIADMPVKRTFGHNRILGCKLFDWGQVVLDFRRKRFLFIPRGGEAKAPPQPACNFTLALSAGQLVVGQVWDEALADVIAPGDRILSLDGHPWDGDVCRFLLDPDPLDGTVCGIGTASGQHVVLTIETMK